MGAVCQSCQYDLTISKNTEVQFAEPEWNRDPRMVIATEKFETEELHYEDQVDRIWLTHDKDMDGLLNQQEAIDFLRETLRE